jgi:hypothetical protein
LPASSAASKSTWSRFAICSGLTTSLTVGLCGARAAVTAILAGFGQDAIEAPPKSPRLDLERLDLMPKLLDLVRWLERRRDA